MRMTVVAEPDNRRNKGDRDSDFCKGSHDASILCYWGITLSHAASFLTRRFTVLAVVLVWEKRGPPSVQAGPRLKYFD